MNSILQTEFEFELPIGYLDSSGTKHQRGVMRLATAADEVLPMRDPRVQSNPAYLSIILLSRIVTKLGSVPMIDTDVIENLYRVDFAHLQDMYNRINNPGSDKLIATCPKCNHMFKLD